MQIFYSTFCLLQGFVVENINDLVDQSVQRPAAYSFLAKSLHWGFVVIFTYGIYKQVDNVSLLADPSLLRLEIIFALGFLALLIIRFCYMRFTQKSSLPEGTGSLHKLAAKIVHYGLYLSFASIALSGLVIGALYYLGIQDGLIINSLIGLHEFSVILSYYLIGTHILAAIYHRFLRDGVWSSMVPLWREK